MVSFVRLAPILAAIAIAPSCRLTSPPGPIDSTLASCVPSGTLALAGISLDQLRTTPLYQSLPPSTLAAFEILRDASYLLLASNGKDLLLIARGKFREAPPGATLISANLAIAGPPDTIRTAIAQHRTGVTGAPQLLDWGAGIASGKQIWAVAQGGVRLPLTGNAANLNRILNFSGHVTLAAQIDSRFQIDATGVCRTPDAGRRLEESLRALLTFATAASQRQSDLATILKAIEIRRDALTVHATLSISQESAAKLLGELAR